MRSCSGAALWLATLGGPVALCLWGCAGNAGGTEAESPGKSQATSAPAAEGAGGNDGPDGRGHVVLLPPGRDAVRVASEVVFTPAKRQWGLQHRQQLAESAGMLFLFESERLLSFWMINTYLALDMVFIRNDMTVLGVVENAEPLTETPRRVPGRSQYVLEVNAGYCREHGIAAGTRVQFEGVEDEFGAMPGLSR